MVGIDVVRDVTRRVKASFDQSLAEATFSTLFAKLETGIDPMKSYIVQSGTVDIRVVAESAAKAAVWAVHRVMGQIVPIEPIDHLPSSTSNVRDTLGSEVRVSVGGRHDVAPITLATIEVIGEWNRMVCTLDRLDRMLHHAV